MNFLAIVTTSLLALPAEPPSLVGSWGFIQDGIEHKLILSKDGTCLLSSRPKDEKKGIEEKGKYIVDDKKVTITLNDKTVDFGYSLRGDRLTLKGGKFGDEGVVFKKDQSVDARKLVGNWECIGGKNGTKILRFRSDGTYSRWKLSDFDQTLDNLDKGDQINIKANLASAGVVTGQYSFEEDNSLKLTDSADTTRTVSALFFEIKLHDDELTLKLLKKDDKNNPAFLFPAGGYTFRRKKEVTEFKPSPAENLPGSAAWDLNALKRHFNIVKTTYDKEKREVVWLLETKRDISTELRGGAPRISFRFYDADDVSFDDIIEITYRPTEAAFKKGDKLRGVLTMPPEQTLADTKKVIASEKP